MAGSGRHHRPHFAMLATIGLVASILVIDPNTALATTSPPPGFISANGTHLSLDGAPFRFSGLNVYNANSDGWCWFQYSDAQFDQALSDMGPGTNVIRAWFFQPLATTPSGQRDWTRFDRTLQIAGQHGIRVIVTLTDQWGECGATSTSPYKDRAWYESGYATDVLPDSTVPYRDWVSEVVTRYKDNPNVAFWQLINEAEVNEVVGGVPQPCPPGNGPADILRTWAQDVGGLVKSIDPNHLVSLGTIGSGQCGAQGAQYQYVHDIPQIDLCEFHDYGAPNVGIPGDQFNGLQVRLNQCAAINKPLFVGEAGIIPDDVGGTLQDRADAFAAKMRAQFDAGVVGFLAWAWSSLGSTTNNYDVGPGDPALAALAGSPFIVQIAAGGVHTCALSSGGAVWCWGGNANGQLGDGTMTDSLTPVEVSGLSSGVAAISAGSSYTCALMISGGVKCWGSNFMGQLGDGTQTDRVTPVDVSGLTNGVAAISAGNQYACALMLSGGAKCWGFNYFGQLGTGTATTTGCNCELTAVDASALPSGIVSISAGQDHTCAITSSGGAQCWGYNPYGQLGDGTTANRITPGDVLGLTSGVQQISPAGYATCAVTTSGDAKCWGHNDSGVLGDGTQSDRSTPGDVSGLTSGISRIASASAFACALTGSGGVKCWGMNGNGEVGDGSLTDRPTPVDVSGLTSGVVGISVTRDGHHACALMTSGGVKCWGWNIFGQLGDGTTTLRSAPVDVLFASTDTTAPTITLNTPPDGASYTLGQQVNADYSCADEPGGSGLASCVGTVMSGTTIVGTVTSGTAIDTSTVAPYSLTVDAYDNAGHHSQTTHNYTVVAPTFGVTSVTPSSVGRGVNLTTLTVLGSAFTNGSTVAILGGSGYSIIGGTTFVDSTHLTVNVSVGNNATLGAHDVRVTRPSGGGSAICAGCLTINPKPTITTVVPSSAPQGATRDVVINGTGFAPGALVSFGGSGITVNSVSGSGTSLAVNVSIDVGAATGVRSLTVTDPDGGFAAKTSAFTVNALPTITSVAPASRAQGVTATVVISGTGYAAGAGASFGVGVTVTSVTRTAGKLTAHVVVDPAALVGMRDVTVTNADAGSVICFGCFTVNAAPTIATISPDSRAAGAPHQSITVTGSGFQPGVKALIPGGGVTVNSTTLNDPNTLTLDITVGGGAAAGPRNLTVTNLDGGVVTCGSCFTVNAKPTVTVLSPVSQPRGTPGATVTVTGTGFRAGATVTFSGTGVTASVVSISADRTTITLSLSVTAAAATGYRSVTVTNPDGGVVTKSNAFRVT